MQLRGICLRCWWLLLFYISCRKWDTKYKIFTLTLLQKIIWPFPKKNFTPARQLKQPQGKNKISCISCKSTVEEQKYLATFMYNGEFKRKDGGLKDQLMKLPKAVSTEIKQGLIWTMQGWVNDREERDMQVFDHLLVYHKTWRMAHLKGARARKLDHTQLCH